MPASARGRRKRNKTRIAVATIGKQQIDVSKSRLHMIASQCEAVLRMRGIRFEESSGCIAVTNRAAKYKIRPLTTERLIKLLNHVAEFGSFKCRDERGCPTCWEARSVPIEAARLVLDRIRGRHQLEVSRVNRAGFGQRIAVQ